LGPRLFPPEDGAVFALDSSQKTLEAVATWGTHPVGAAAFSADSCWAMRNGRTHVVQDSGLDVLCAHLPKPVPAAYLSTPPAPLPRRPGGPGGRGAGVLVGKDRGGGGAAAPQPATAKAAPRGRGGGASGARPRNRAPAGGPPHPFFSGPARGVFKPPLHGGDA